MHEHDGRKLESRIETELAAKAARGRMYDGFEGDKVVNEVLDRPTVHTIHGMMRSGIISYVNGVVSAGKESVLFWAAGPDGDVALKTYLVTTSSFKRRMQYVAGDPRFSRVRRGTRNIVYLWARKEFANLARCVESGLPVPRPVRVSGNVLAMEFVGRGGRPAATLSCSDVGTDDYEAVISLARRLYRDARLVHGDLSPYNIFKSGRALRPFDLGSAVDVRHPNSAALLRRDINNMTDFFVRRGLTVRNPADVLEEVTS